MIVELRDDQWLWFTQISPYEEEILWKNFSVVQPGSEYIDPEAAKWDGIHRFYNRAKRRMARPLLSMLRRVCKENQLALGVHDNRGPAEYSPMDPEQVGPDLLPGITLEEYQVRAVRKACTTECGIIYFPTGAGKCLGRGTLVLMYDGTTKRVEDVLPGDLLMGDDSTPRTVLSACRGHGPLYQIKQKNGHDYVVNDAHILTLYRSRASNKHADATGGSILDMPLGEYLTQSRWMKHLLKGVKTGVEFPGDGAVPFDPYLLGVWLGDGISTDLQFCLSEESDKAIIQYLSDYCAANNYELVKYSELRTNCDIYAIRLYGGVHKPTHIHHWAINPLKQLFARHDLFHNKHIPHVFKCAGRQARLALLAGLLDADAGQSHNGYDLTLKKTKLAQDVVFLARSLGFRVGVSDVWKYDAKSGKGDWYAGINIYGHTDEIPVRVPYKRCAPRRQKKNPLVCGIEVVPLGPGDYFGFTLDGNGRFLLGDFTITHNTEVMAGIVAAIECPTVILANQTVVIDQIKERLELRKVAEEVGLFYAGKRPNGQLVMVGSVQSLVAPTKQPVMPTRTLKDTPRAWQKKLDRYELQCKAFKTRLKNARILQKLVKQAHMIMVDECDLAASKLYKQVFRYICRARRRYGFSGTPFDESKPVENMVVQSHLGGIIAMETRDTIQALGRIIPVKYRMLVIDGDPKEASTYDLAFKEHIIQSPLFWKLITGICLKYPNEGTLILVDKEELGNNLSRELAAVGIEAPFIYGKTPKKRRDAELKRFQHREVKVIIGGKIINRGLDLKSGCENLIIATGGKLKSDFVQKIGRAVRRNHKGYSRVFDFYFKCNRYLYQHSRARLCAMVEMGYETSVIYQGGQIDGKELIRRRYRFPAANPRQQLLKGM